MVGFPLSYVQKKTSSEKTRDRECKCIEEMLQESFTLCVFSINVYIKYELRIARYGIRRLRIKEDMVNNATTLI